MTDTSLNTSQDTSHLFNRQFCREEQQSLLDIIFARRDVRGNQFIGKAIPETDLDLLFRAANAAPSVGLSQPWEFILVTDPDTKKAIYQDSLAEKQKAESGFSAEQKQKYRDMKLEGILEAPVSIAVYCRQPEHKIIGNNSMPQTVEYSVVCAIQNMWLMARSLNIGMGWVSIISPAQVSKQLQVPEELTFMAWLCLGYSKEFLEIPEFEKTHWASRKDHLATLSYEKYQQKQPKK